MDARPRTKVRGEGRSGEGREEEMEGTRGRMDSAASWRETEREEEVRWERGKEEEEKGAATPGAILLEFK